MTWGLVATVKAPARAILDFAAYHLDLGAHRLYLYLDAPEPEVQARLKAHPKIRVTACDRTYWKRRGMARPVKHQVRQSVNATHAYGRCGTEIDWLAHIDVDEFLWPDNDVLAERLAALPADRLCARVRPVEALAGEEDLFKGFIPPGPERAATVARLYPRFGPELRGGFLSHVAGKMLVRTGLGPVRFRIHNVFLGEATNPGSIELTDVALCHRHAPSWSEWNAAYRFRLSKGAYRAELPPGQPRDLGGQTLHELLADLEQSEGTDGLRAFFDEVCADTPALRQRLRSEGLLRHCPLRRDEKRRKHFPDFDSID